MIRQLLLISLISISMSANAGPTDDNHVHVEQVGSGELDLTINQSSNTTDLLTQCDSLTWIDGNTYNSNNNTATYTLANSAGCDSLGTLKLRVN